MGTKIVKGQQRGTQKGAGRSDLRISILTDGKKT